MLLTLPNEALHSVSDKVNTAGRWGKRQKKKQKKKQLNVEYFPVRVNFQKKLPYWMCRNVSKSVFIFFPRETDDSLATTQRCSRFPLHIFAPGWFQLSHALPRGVLLLLLSPRALTRSRQRHSAPVPDWTFKIKKNYKKLIERQAYVRHLEDTYIYCYFYFLPANIEFCKIIFAKE